MERRSLALAIRRRGLKLQHIADELGINRCTLRAKLGGQYEWKLGELCALQGILHMDGEDFWQIVEDEWRRNGAGKETAKHEDHDRV